MTLFLKNDKNKSYVGRFMLSQIGHTGDALVGIGGRGPRQFRLVRIIFQAVYLLPIGSQHLHVQVDRLALGIGQGT